MINKLVNIIMMYLFCLHTSLVNGAELMTKLMASEESKSYKLVKISNSDSIGEWSNKENEQIINLKNIKNTLNLDSNFCPEAVKRYISTLTNDFSESLILKNSIKREYDYSKYWTAKNSMLSIEEFQELSSQSDLNAFLGPLSSIPTRSDGIAKFNLRHNGEVISFLSFASKKKFTIRPIYWAYFYLYTPYENSLEKNDIVIVVANAPDNSLAYNGVYILVPKNVFDI